MQNSVEVSGHVKCATKKLALLDDQDKKSLLIMKATIDAFASRNRVDAFVIKGRQATGLRASGGITFKIETLFQLSDPPVIFVNPVTLSKFAKSNYGGIPSSVVSYQAHAYRAAAWHLAKY